MKPASPASALAPEPVGPAIAVAIAALVLLGLLLDASPWRSARPVVTVAVLALWSWIWLRSVPDRRCQMVVCLLLATLGEMLLSLGFGLYDYRGGGIPVFVPPGHVLLFALGMRLAARAPQRLPGLVAMAALPLATGLALWGRDEISLLLVLLFAVLIFRGPAPRLYAVMFLLALALELWGTWLGCWAWRPDVPGLHLRSLNPPFAAGAFYCVLDWLTVLLARVWRAPVVPGPPALAQLTEPHQPGQH